VSQRNSGYKRKRFDSYSTPPWVVEALIPHLGTKLHIWEPAAGNGNVARALADAGCVVEASDISEGRDFLKTPTIFNCDAIVTNPPYSLAAEFIEHAVKVMQPCMGKVAMLLRTDFDHAISRRHLFAHCPCFAKKLVLTKRIVWFEPKKASPSFNHAWFIWDWRHVGPPVLAYDIQPNDRNKAHLVNVNRLTAKKRAQLAPASRKARPTASRRIEFAQLRRAWLLSRKAGRGPTRG
jgi:hypothetical protein